MNLRQLNDNQEGILSKEDFDFGMNCCDFKKCCKKYKKPGKKACKKCPKH